MKSIDLTQTNQTAKFYDFYRDGVSQSMIDSWLRCPKQCYYEYVEGWTPKEEVSQALLFGNICHYVLEQCYNTKLIEPEHIFKFVSDYEEENDYSSLSVSEKYDTEITYSKAEATMIGYFKYYAETDFQKNWEPTERQFKLSTEEETFLVGKIDTGFAATENDKIWLMDHKCMSRITFGNLLVMLPVDIQINTYMYAYWKLTGKCPAGFYYNIIRNTGKKPLQKKDEPLRDFRDRLIEEISKNPKEFFYRIKIPICQEELEQWEQNWLFPVLRDMRRWYDSNYQWPEYYRPRNLMTEYGSLASMAYAVVQNDFSRYVKKDRPFIELEIKDEND